MARAAGATSRRMLPEETGELRAEPIVERTSRIRTVTATSHVTPSTPRRHSWQEQGGDEDG